MNRDTTIVQVAILFIVIAILGVAIYNKQNPTLATTNTTKTVVVQQINEGSVNNNDLGNVLINEPDSVITNSYTERMNSPRTNLVKQYFAYIANKEYKNACSLLTNGKCASTRPGAVENFTREFEKLKNGYEYINVKDYGIQAPSGKDVTCVKYSYRYKDDPNPALISEVLSFYTSTVDGETLITDRVCEKKYKDGTGIRPCPIEPAARFCEGKVR